MLPTRSRLTNGKGYYTKSPSPCQQFFSRLLKLFLTRQKGAVCAPLLADFFQLIDHASQLLTGEAVDAVAELAGEVCLALLAQNVLQLLRAEGEQRALRALARAVAAVFDGRRLQDLEVKIGKHRAQEVCRIGIVAELICHAGRGVDAALDLGDGILARAGEELNEICLLYTSDAADDV